MERRGTPSKLACVRTCKSDSLFDLNADACRLLLRSDFCGTGPNTVLSNSVWWSSSSINLPSTGCVTSCESPLDSVAWSRPLLSMSSMSLYILRTPLLAGEGGGDQDPIIQALDFGESEALLGLESGPCPFPKLDLGDLVDGRILSQEAAWDLRTWPLVESDVRCLIDLTGGGGGDRRLPKSLADCSPKGAIKQCREQLWAFLRCDSRTLLDLDKVSGLVEPFTARRLWLSSGALLGEPDSSGVEASQAIDAVTSSAAPSCLACELRGV
mmetsp:Transcript_1404/g.3814  ORF Transcript_1404/g.3814 Transcript_1404/m.3814 type:complete len:269 (+) Transcript_1404:206-1012(+)